LTIGGETAVVRHLDPIFNTLAPGRGEISGTPSRAQIDGTAEEGYLHCGPPGAGHFVKMIHNGIEYGLMQAYAEGFDILRNADSTELPTEHRYDFNLADIAEVWRRGSVVGSWLLDLTAMALIENPPLSDYTGFVQDSGEGRWTITAAIEEVVPAEVLSASLYTRFRSRREHTYAEKVLSAMRYKFGGHDEMGALRDIVPNHMFQLLALTAMEPPISFAADAVRDESSKILHAIPPMTPEDVLTRTVRGQYGEAIEGDHGMLGYRSEPAVKPESATETFVAMKLAIDNWCWAEVPFYLRTGKRLPKRVTEIAVQFKRAPLILFRNTSVEKLTPNRLVIHIQPDEGISLSFGAKVPGPLVSLGTVHMDFRYTDYFGSTPSTGYERLLYDCMCGDPTLFQRSDMVEAGWSVAGPILDVWNALPPRSFPNYAAGSWGPNEADALLERDGRQWRRIDA
jgi:hypothetical protein